MSTNTLKNQFQWEEEIPEIGRKGDLFRDRIFVVSGNRGKIIKLSASFAYDKDKQVHSRTSMILPDIRFEMKILEGEKLLKQVIDLQFRYTLGATTGATQDLQISYQFGTTNMSWREAENKFVYSTSLHPNNPSNFASNFDSIFCDGNHGKKVTYSLSAIIVDRPIIVDRMDEEPIMEKCLKLPEMLYMEKESSDIKLICGREIFECHKLVLTCQSDVFKTMFKYKSSKFLTYFFKL